MIHVKDLCKEFKSAKREAGFKGSLKGLFSRAYEIKKAVENISFDVAEGEIVGYIGSNGAGKSTTIKMMTGILMPTSGECTINGIVPFKNRQTNAKQIGVVFGQRTQLWWDLPLTETFTILKEIYNVSETDFKNRMEFFNEVLDIPSFVKSQVRTLSLGQRMRADLAASLLHNPKVLFLDEPTIGLDVVVKDRMRKAIKDINKEFNTTVILTTHDLVDIEELCSRIIIIDTGKKVYDGDLKQIKDTYGYMSSVDIEVKNPDKVEDIDFNAHFSLSKDDLSSGIENNILKIRFNKNKISVGDIAAVAFQHAYVLDMSISGTDITEIIKNIYEKGV